MPNEGKQIKFDHSKPSQAIQEVQMSFCQTNSQQDVYGNTKHYTLAGAKNGRTLIQLENLHEAVKRMIEVTQTKSMIQPN